MPEKRPARRGVEDKVNQFALKAVDTVDASGASAAVTPKTNVVLPFVQPSPANRVTGEFVRNICQLRRKRQEAIPAKLLGDATWDILLQLYAAHLDTGRVSISRVTRSSRIPATTVLRRLVELEKEGLVTRSEDPFDARRVYVALSLAGAEAMDRCFAASGPRAAFF